MCVIPYFEEIESASVKIKTFFDLCPQEINLTCCCCCRNCCKLLECMCMCARVSIESADFAEKKVRYFWEISSFDLLFVVSGFIFSTTQSFLSLYYLGITRTFFLLLSRGITNQSTLLSYSIHNRSLIHLKPKFQCRKNEYFLAAKKTGFV